MVDSQRTVQVIETLLSKIELKHQEIGRFLLHDEFEHLDPRIILWAARENVRDLKETSITDLEEFSDIEIKLTFAPPSFFEDVLSGKNVPYWQVATVMRILKTSEIVYDPRGKLEQWLNQAELVEWQPEVIQLKQKTTRMLLDRVSNRISEDMLADAYIWLIKAAEEAICVPLMTQNAFGLGTASLLLDTLQRNFPDIYDFYSELIGVSRFDPNKLNKARQELEILADKLYQQNVKTDREMWILAAFVSINESELRLKQSLEIKVSDDSSSILSRLFETAVAELWNSYFLVAQNPRKAVKLDPWVVGSFWNWFGSPDIDEEWLKEKEKDILDFIA